VTDVKQTPATQPPPGERGERGEQTRQLIIDTAVRLFGEQGYEKTTMRAIATEAGLAPSNAYYYFPSKDHLVQEFYNRIQIEQREAVAPYLAGGGDLGARLHAAMSTGVAAMEPYHAFAGKFFRVAADPSSASNPFSPESAPARQLSQEIFRDVVAGAGTQIDPDVRAVLPELLWLAQLGVTLFWIYDRSPGRSKTRLLVDRAVPLIDRMVGLSRLRVLRPAVREALSLYRALRS
jgi:AcrR family transcriptional regulator